MSKQLLTFNNAQYLIDNLRTVMKTGPKIIIKSTELADDFTTAVKHPEGFDDSRETVAFYQYNGKHYILLGLSKVKQLLEANEGVLDIKGYLVTKHMLKRTQDVPAAPLHQTEGVNDFSAAPQQRYRDRGERTPYRERRDDGDRFARRY